MDIYNIKFLGEDSDTKPVVKRNNIAIKTKHNGFLSLNNAIWSEWIYCIIFPDEEKAEYFLNNFKEDEMDRFQEGMLKDDYIFHVVHFKYPKRLELYADQCKMSKDY